MSIIHYKFKNVSKKWESLTFEQAVVSVLDLKRAIVKAKHLNKKTELRDDFDLVITNAQTGENYSADGYMIPKNSSVTVLRVPAKREKSLIVRLEAKGGDVVDGPNETPTEYTGDDFGGSVFAAKKAPTEAEQQMAAAMQASLSSATLTGVTGTAAVASSASSSNLSFLQNVVGGNSAAVVAVPEQSEVPRPGYVCNNCGGTDHFFKNCPQTGEDVSWTRPAQKTSGIPRSMLQHIESGKTVKGKRALDIGDGKIAVQATNEHVFNKAFQNPSLQGAARPVPEPKSDPHPDLKCPICSKYFTDCVVIPCCFTSFCDPCIRQTLLMDGQCPSCNDTSSTVDALKPNNGKRKKVAEVTGGGSNGGGGARNGSSRNNTSNNNNNNNNRQQNSSSRYSRQDDRKQRRGDRGRNRDQDNRRPRGRDRSRDRERDRQDRHYNNSKQRSGSPEIIRPFQNQNKGDGSPQARRRSSRSRSPPNRNNNRNHNRSHNNNRNKGRNRGRNNNNNNNNNSEGGRGRKPKISLSRNRRN